ncbi:hypothetical protein [Granulosicoccus antarcticus]|nr:hypothetical protein [Granulosicoccus antarcticus]
MCDGFHHPLAEVWTENNGLGEVRTFTDLSGNRKSYVLQSIERTSPRENIVNGSDPNRVSCLESAEYLYVESSSDMAFEFDILQRDVRADQPTEDQTVRLTFNVQNPVGTDTDMGTLIRFELDDLAFNNLLGSTDGSTNPREIEYIPQATVNNEVYADLLQHTFIDNSTRFTDGVVDEQAQWVRVLLAKDIGLLQYELLNGTVYTLTRD